MVDKLTATEKAVALMAADGAGNDEIARALHLTASVVGHSLSMAYRLLDLPPDKNERVLLALLVEREKRDKEGQ